MRLKLNLLAAFCLLTVDISFGQTSANSTEVVPPQYGGVQTYVSGLFVTPIPNIPLTATVDISTMRILPDGSTELRKTENHIARASSGRIYNERRVLVRPDYPKTPTLLSSRVYDPQTRVSVDWTPFSNVAQSRVLSERTMAERKPFTTPVPGSTDQDLGMSTMSGTTVHGLRRTRVFDSGSVLQSKPITITDEYWYSEDLHLIMLQKHDDPRTGEQIVTVLNVNRAEPNAHLFDLPENYRVVDVTPTGPGTAVNAKSNMGAVPVR